MVVADITDDVILGIDFLEHQKAVINLTDYSIELRGEKIPSTVISTEHEKKMKIYRVKLAKRTVVPPYSDKISVAEFDETPDNDIVLQPTEFMKGLLIPNMICQGRKQVSIMLRNPNEDYKTLKCGYYIGIGIEACQIMDDDETEIKTKVFKVNIIGTEQGHPHEKEKLEELEKHLPVHLKQLFKRSIDNLNLQQSIQLAKLFLNFEEIFATSDLDIGLFNAEIKHRIDTQESHPVKQRMRRTP